MRSILRSSPIILATCICMLVPVSLYAEATTRTSVSAEGRPVPRGTLFQTENPKEMFNQKVAETDRYGIVMLRGWQEEPAPADDKKKAQKTIDENKIPESAEEIEALYGSPDEPEPLKAHEDAPRPFKAMMAALNLGNDELAYKYSKKWVTYLDTVDKAAIDVTGLTGKVMKSQGVLSADADWANAEKYARFDGIVNEDIKRELEQPEGKVDTLLRFVPKELKETISGKDAFMGESEELFYDDKQIRAQLKAALNSKVPSFGNTRVDVYFFFQPGKTYSNLMAKEIDELHAKSKTLKNVNVIAVTKDAVSKGEYEEFKYSTGVHYNAITGNSKLKEIFHVSGSPEIVIHIPEYNKRFHEKGLRKAFYLEEVVNALTREGV